MSDISDRLEKQAELLFQNVSGWQTNALRRIGRRVKEIKSLSYADLQALNNATVVNQDINAILNELATVTEQNALAVQEIYAQMLEEQHLENEPLYDYRNKPFVPFKDNKQLQSIVRAYAKTTAKTMVNLSMTKARQIGTVDKNGHFVPLRKSFHNVLDKAVMSITTGTGDFHSEMRDVLKELGGSGMRVDYSGGVTRRLDTMVRQNLLWGAKQAGLEYSDMIGEELNCDGIEIDWHSNPRPSHAFMQGKQYALGKARTVGGIHYESADDALRALEDYGCLHFKFPIILGVSIPAHSKSELARLNTENAKPIEIDGVSKSGYEWKQTMRRLETESRKTREQKEILKSSGDNEGARQLNAKLNAIDVRYRKIAEASGIGERRDRMGIVKGNAVKSVDKSRKSGIINYYKGKSIPIANDVDISSITINKISSATEKVVKDFKILSEYSEEIKFEYLKDGLAVNQYTPGIGINQITLDKNYFSNELHIIEKLKSDFKNGISYKTEQIESLIAHEMGHNAHIAFALKRARLKYGKPLNVLEIDAFEQQYDKISQEIYLTCFSNEEYGEIQDICVEQLGSMVRENAHELIAQSFGNYYYGENKSTIAKKIIKYFKRGLK